MEWVIGIPLLAVVLGYLSEMLQRHTATRQRDQALRDAEMWTRRAARAEGYAAVLDETTRRYQQAVRALHVAHPSPDSPERDRVATASGDLDRVRRLHQEASWDR